MKKTYIAPSVTTETLTVRDLLAASTIYIDRDSDAVDANTSLSNRKIWDSENQWGNSGIWANKE
ncbi:MAG: hypothetical protein J1F06_00280 [Prevotellaceae bacterium]|nr:hypothetical protein [Prevotellaceae bacterium]